MARQFSEAADDNVRQDESSVADNVQMVDFPRRDALRLP
jgi:hypothetical protein